MFIGFLFCGWFTCVHDWAPVAAGAFRRFWWLGDVRGGRDLSVPAAALVEISE
jgi:hypothetical protein